MRRLPLRLLAVALALVGLVVLAGLEQRVQRHEADRRVAQGLAGYLSLAVPASPYGDYAADRLLSTLNRLHGSAYWHAGLQVWVGGTAVFDAVTLADGAARVPLPGPLGRDTVGVVEVWNVTLRSELPAASAILAAATFLVAGLAATRRARWLWPLLGMALLVLVMRSVLRETGRVADQVATTTLTHLGPLAALLLIDPRFPASALQGLGKELVVTELPGDSAATAPGWRDTPQGRMTAVRMVRGTGMVVELAAPAPPSGSRALELGLAGAGMMLLLAMLPPIVPRRRPRLPTVADRASIPE
jgi:hypothetical protein